MGLWLGRNRRESSTALGALQIVEVEAQQIEGTMNDSDAAKHNNPSLRKVSDA